MDAAHASIKLLKFLRTVLLQDAALLKDRFPELSIWTQPVFSSPAFQEFAAEVKVFYKWNIFI